MKNWMVLIVDALTPSLLFVLCAVANLTVVTSDPCSPAGKSIHATSGHISSPNFPNNYDANRICTWNITVPGGKTIKLTFLNFTLVAGENDDCAGAAAGSARVFITNVASHGGKPNDFKICGQKLPPPVYSEGHFIQVRFESRTGLVNKGFNAIFQAIDGDSLCPTDMILDETSGSFSSPYNPRNYPFNQTCSWKIIGKQGYRVELTIPDYNLERCDGAACSCDYLEVQSSFSDQVLPRKLCGTPMHIPVKFYSLHESLRVLFVSDDTNMDYDGFGATYKLLNYSPPICPKEAIPLSGSGKISSTNYPKSNYTASINCTWNITAPADKIVNFTFTDFVLSECSGNGCSDSCSYVELYDGGSTSSPSLGRFCQGSSWNEPQLSNGSQMFVMFHPGQTVNRGFEAKYESTTTGVPAAIVAMDNHTVVKNGTIELYCNVFGTPPPTVLWTHVKSGETWNQKKWTISDIQVEELGEYRCNASNKYGGDIKSTFILYEGGFCEKQCTDGKLCLKFGATYVCICPEGKTGEKCEKTDTPKKDFIVGLKLKGEFKQEYENLENPETKMLVKKIEKNMMEEFKGTGLTSVKVLKLRQGSIIADLKLTFNDSVGESSVNALLTQAANRGKIGDTEVEEISVGKTFPEPTTTSVPPEDCGTFFEGEDCKKVTVPRPVPSEPAKVNKDAIYGSVIGVLAFMFAVAIIFIAWKRHKREKDDRLNTVLKESHRPHIQNEAIELESSDGNLSTVVHHGRGNYMELNEVRSLNEPATDPARSYLEINEYAPLHPGTRSWEVERENVTIEKVIGKGAFGQVAQGKASNLRGREETITVAIKMLKDPLLVLIEYVPYGDLLGYLRKSRHLEDNYFKDPDIKPQTSLTSQQLMKFSWQVADGMHYLSSKNIIHRDLAARNVLVGEQERCKVTDFGMARDVCQENIYERKSKGRLPVKWTACEALLYGRYTTKSDVWSFGIVLYEIFTIGGSPYPKIDGRKMADLLTQGYRMPKPRHVDDTLYKIMQDCWQENPDDRPIFENLKNDLKEMENQHQRLINMQHYDNILYASMD